MPNFKVCDSYPLGVRINSFHQPQFDLNSSWVDFFEKVFIYVKEKLFLKWYKGRKRLFPSHSIRSKSVSNNFSEKVFAKIKSLSVIRIINKPAGAKFKTWHSMLQKVYKLMEPLVPRASSHVWYWFLSFGCKKQFFPSASIQSEFILSRLLWEGMYVCKRYFFSEVI